MSWREELRYLIRKLDRRRAEQELDEEIQAHLEMEIQERIDEGLSPEEARYAARRAFGSVTVAIEDTRALWGMRQAEALWQDLRFGVRTLLKRPGFTAITTLTLALGIGANTAILSTINGFVLRPLPVHKPEELVVPRWGSKEDAEVWGGVSYANYVDLRERNQSLSGLLAWSMTSAGISSNAGGDDVHADVIWGELVSSNFFDVLGVKPVLGRGFLPEEERTQNTSPVVVVSHSLWQQRFEGDPGIIGKTLYLNGTPFTVVGVAPASFKGTKPLFRQAFWAPLMMSAALGTGGDWDTERGRSMFKVIGRLKPGVTAAQAETDLNLIAEALAEEYPKSNADTKVQVCSEPEARFSEVTRIFRLGGLFALVVSGLVLLVACANVANLMLARAAARGREIGTRLALGAGRWRIARQLLTESVLLALLGGAFGWLFAYVGTGLVHASMPPIPYPLDFDFNPDTYVLKWMVAVTLATGVIFGLVPALVASRPNLVEFIKSGTVGQSYGTRRWSLRSVLVVTQVAISIVVLICAGLFLRSLNVAMRLDPGFNTENLVTMKLEPSLLGYDDAAGMRFYAETVRRVETLPGVRAASLASYLPLGDSNGSVSPVVREGEPEPPPNQGIEVSSDWVGPGYFAAVKTPLVMGRDFTERDDKDAPLVVIVNQEFARKFYGSEENAIGKRFRFWSGKEPLREIVGIAKDGLYLSIYEDPRPYIFLPEYQLHQGEMMLLVSAQTSGDLRAVAESVRQEIARVDARVPVYGVTLAGANMSFAYWSSRFAAGIASAFGMLALLLATMGLYSLMTYSVSQRTRELGIRMALGAEIRDVLRLIMREGLQLVAIGIVVGVAVAFASTRLLANLLLGVGASDPITFAGTALLLVAVALVACYLPARRAAKVDPLVSLRFE